MNSILLQKVILLTQKALVLLADDNDDIRMLFSMMLSEYKVIHAKNGEEAVTVYKEHKPDLVLMDILMPVKDGIDATEEIIEFDPKAKIIAITAYFSRSKDIIQVGASQVMRKPFEKSELLEVVEKELL
ncbi:MAG: response regulator [Candidatus Heimdallarchaeota archaeon]|nr:response regulator [Candidatus Heimdallarchaeota archaeon]MCK4253654.1 response regulator [Candidatus Heimdallarchaeota archaeon]